MQLELESDQPWEPNASRKRHKIFQRVPKSLRRLRPITFTYDVVKLWQKITAVTNAVVMGTCELRFSCSVHGMEKISV